MPIQITAPAYPRVMTCVYRLYDAAGVLLYVGATYDFDKRFKDHAKEKRWWPEVARKDVLWFDNRFDAMYEEARAIRDELPRYNERPGLQPLGAMVIKRAPYSRATHCKVGELVVSKTGLDRVFDEVRGRSHALLTWEGEPIAVAIPRQWYLKACELAGTPADIDAMPVVHLEDLY